MFEFLSVGPRLCALSVPKSEYQNLSRALICGIALPASQEKELILDAGVIHLLVVSGWHLFFLERALAFLPRVLRIFLLFIYAFFTGFQFPILRALLRRVSRPFLRQRFGFTLLQTEAIGVLIFICADPPAIFSRSFLMCWMGGLAMTLPLFWPKHPHLERSVKAYILLWPFCFASPITLLYNVLLAPWVGFLLFPSVILSFMFHSLTFLSDWVWRGFLEVLRLGPQASPLPVYVGAAKLFWLPACVHILLLYGEVKWRRVRAFSFSFL